MAADEHPDPTPGEEGVIQTPADARMAASAVRRRWPIPPSMRQEMIDAAIAMIRSGDAKAKRAGMQLLERCEAQNQADEERAEKYGRLDAGKATESVEVTDLRIPPPRAIDQKE